VQLSHSLSVLATPMSAPNIICLVVDGLRASALGTYGAAGCDTPAFDRLASESFVFDQAWIDNPNLNLIYRGFWQGLAAIMPEESGVPLASLPAWLEGQGYQTLLITDEPIVAEHTLAVEFQEVHLLPPGEEENAHDLSQTQCARLFADLLDSLESMQNNSASEPKFIWLHAQGFLAPWDGPLDLRYSLADEEDPLPPDFTSVPHHQLASDYDPDELLGVTQAYAGQVLVLDACLAALLDYFHTSPWRENTALMVMGSRGFPLGEHLRVGLIDEALFGELLHVPCMWRMPDGANGGFRSTALVQPCDVAATLAELPGATFPDATKLSGKNLLPVIQDETENLREAILIHGTDGERAIRTTAWHLRWHEDEPAELFVKPDDRWEANEISARCPEIVANLRNAADQLEAATLQNASILPGLDASLIAELES
jgi:arylsulfatase A-like enzyme